MATIAVGQEMQIEFFFCNVHGLGNHRVPAIKLTREHKFQVLKSDNAGLDHELFQIAPLAISIIRSIRRRLPSR